MLTGEDTGVSSGVISGLSSGGISGSAGGLKNVSAWAATSGPNWESNLLTISSGFISKLATTS